MNRTPEQTARLTRCADWLAAGAPEVQLSEKRNLSGFFFMAWVQRPDTDNRGVCGTTGCIAGALVQFEHPEAEIADAYNPGMTIDGNFLSNDSVGDYAKRLTGLTDQEAELLFTPFDMDRFDFHDWGYDLPDDYDGGMYPLGWTADLPPEKIALVLYHFIETDVIDWELAR